MSKFSVGQKVKVVKDLMQDHAEVMGKVGTINYVEPLTVNGLEFELDAYLVEDLSDEFDYVFFDAELEKVEEEKVYRQGDKFKSTDLDDVLILARCGDVDGKGAEMVLVSIKDGNRWSPPIKVKDKYAITQEEFNRLDYVRLLTKAGTSSNV